eukprot:TRINITY_DN56053_c0_g1_i1.p1 TRINITY_DN56053_c0_g1~~TRINITY_DN56053_c0_g1_i1.p1  ORF type:complete len:124 (+),score=5.55 TRINITY_DN56053_c0_g1_i1:283-654(+)
MVHVFAIWAKDDQLQQKLCKKCLVSAAHNLRHLGVSFDDYAALVQKHPQCSLCGMFTFAIQVQHLSDKHLLPAPNDCIDRDKETGKLRGRLCMRCWAVVNTLQNAQEPEQFMVKALEYCKTAK